MDIKQQDEQKPIDENPDEILTLSQVARILKASTKQVYELTRGRSQARMSHPLPVFTIHNKMKRVRKSDLRDWFNSLVQEQRRGKR